MNKKTKFTILLTFILIFFSGVLSLTVADDDHKSKHRERKRERNRDDDHHESYLRQVNNSTYK